MWRRSGSFSPTCHQLRLHRKDLTRVPGPSSWAREYLKDILNCVDELSADARVRSASVVRPGLCVSHYLAVGENNFIEAPHRKSGLCSPEVKRDNITRLQRGARPAD